MFKAQLFRLISFVLFASLLGACNISGNVTIVPVNGDLGSTATPNAMSTASPTVSATAPIAFGNPEVRVTPTEIVGSSAVCKDHSNIRSGPSGVAFYWRFYISFRNDGITDGCIEVINADSPTTRWRSPVPCELIDNNQAEFSSMDIPDVIPRVDGATPKLESIKLGPAHYIVCNLDLNHYLTMAQSHPDLGIRSTDISSTYAYSYFSISALTILSPSGIYSGSLVTIEPDGCEESESYCQPTLWSASSMVTDTVTFRTTFNGNISTTLITPAEISYTSNLMQAWWVGARAQYTTFNGEWAINIEHHLDQAIMADQLQKIFRHHTTAFGKRFVDSPNSDARFQMWGGNNKIYIGMPPGGASAFNGEIFQISIDPGGAGSPDSAG